MEIGETFHASTRADWREWMMEHHGTHKEIWLLYDKLPESASVSYLDSVEEAICFGWIDGIQKKYSEDRNAQRFSPRKKRSNWTELNKARARRLIELGLMEESGFQCLPDLNEAFEVPSDIYKAIAESPEALAQFSKFPDLYVRVRVGYINELKRTNPDFDRRLQNFIKKTTEGKMYGNWNDGGRLR